MRSVRTREQSIELALEAMVWVMSDQSIPHAVRYQVAKAHTALHGCRSKETVRRMEQEQRLR
jgi:uncharacterized protein (UPF0147 family)